MATKSKKKLDLAPKRLGSDKLLKALNQQVGNEMHASMQYIAIAAHFDAENLPRLAAFFYRQADEERLHSMKFVRHVVDLGGNLAMPAIAALCVITTAVVPRSALIFAITSSTSLPVW